MKRTLSLLLVLALMLCFVPAAHADEMGKCGDNMMYSYNSVIGRLTILGSGAMDDYGLDLYLFQSTAPWGKFHDQITGVSLPSDLTSIGDFAFYDCPRLTSITIPNSVTNIGKFAFCGCTGLTSVTIPSSVTSIGKLAFEGCVSLTSVTIPNSVTTIGEEAFSGCTGLMSFQVAQDNPMYTSIDDVLFSKDKTELIEYLAGKQGSYSIPNSVTSIGDSAFDGCSGLTSVTIPNSVASIGKEAFYDCSGLTSVTIPNSVTSIGDSAFSNCGGLTSVTIPNSVTSIGEYVFSNCWGIDSITIPNSVTSIGYHAFWGCDGLTSITIPNSVTSIGDSAFDQCTGLKDVYYAGTEAQRAAINIGNDNAKLLNATWHYGAGATSAPVITTHPTSTTVNLGATATFRVTATGATGYQWEYQRPGESTWNQVQVNGKAATFNQTNVENRHNGFKFRCKVSNGNGSVYSSVATLTVSAGPIITTQPANISAALGTTATFRVVASNASGYQWEYQRPGESTWNTVQVNGKAATFNQTNVENRHNGFKFRCKVSNGSGSVYSNVATLTVAAGPTITSQPANVSAALGSTATFKVVASNATGYQWEYQRPGESTWNQVQVNGKAATFNQTNVENRHNGFKFRCKVSNGSGSVYSNAATLTVMTAAPIIIGHPSSVTTELGTEAVFGVIADDAQSYQWQYQRPGETAWNDVQIDGKSNIFIQTNVEKRHNGFLFRCKVSNGSASTYSDAAKLTVITTAPTITGQPSNVSAALGTTATFKVTASNATSYQWEYQKPGDSTWYTVQDNGKAATFNQTNVAARHNGFKFRCKVSNGSDSVYSSTATLTVAAVPTITSQPSNVSAALGTTATFRVVASNATGYQWEYQRPGESTWNEVQDNGKSATFNQTNVAARHNGFKFRCKVSNAFGTVYSSTVTLTTR